MDEIRAEGYDGNGRSCTRAIMDFLGLRGGIPVYVAAKCGYEYVLDFAGVGDNGRNQIGRRQGFILHNRVEIVKTGRIGINNCGMWEG